MFWIFLIAYDAGKFKASKTEDNEKDQWYTDYLLQMLFWSSFHFTFYLKISHMCQGKFTATCLQKFILPEVKNIEL